MTAAREKPEHPTLKAEAGGWIAQRRPVPALEKKSAAELLALTAELPGNLRYGRMPEGVVICGEFSCAAGELSLDEARSRFRRLTRTKTADPPEPAEEVVEAALDGSGLHWARRDAIWVVAAEGGLQREIQVARQPGGVRVEAVLIEWDQIDPTERAVLAQFLTAAQPGLRFARAELDGSAVRLAALVENEFLENELGHCLRGVAAGCRCLAREARALLEPAVAQAYLAFHGPGTASAAGKD